MNNLAFPNSAFPNLAFPSSAKIIPLLSCLLSACTVGPDFTPPETSLPEAFQGSSNYSAAESKALINWQGAYQDPQLQALIETALTQNFDLLTAVSRIKEARALAGVADSAYYPSVDVFFENERVAEGDDPLDDTLQLKGQVAWELDLFGYNRRASEAAWAELKALGQARYVVEMNLVADVAKTYFAYKDVTEKVQLSESTVALRKKAFDIAKLRKENGMISGLDVRQAEVELESAKVTIPRLKLEQAQTLNQLKLLLADEKAQVLAGLNLSEQILPVDIPVGIPSEVLRRRPDVLQAEAALHSATAQVGMATADLFPKISITGEFGFESNDLSNLLSGDSLYWEAVGGLTQPLFNAGRLRDNLTAAEERAYQASLAYKKVVLNAFLDVSNQLTSYQSSQVIFLAQQNLLDAADEYERLARIRYRNGVASALDFMDAQRKEFDAELDFSSAKKERLVAFADLYKALGGGWTQPEEPVKQEEPVNQKEPAQQEGSAESTEQQATQPKHE